MLEQWSENFVLLSSEQVQMMMTLATLNSQTLISDLCMLPYITYFCNMLSVCFDLNVVHQQIKPKVISPVIQPPCGSIWNNRKIQFLLFLWRRKPWFFLRYAWYIEQLCMRSVQAKRINFCFHHATEIFSLVSRKYRIKSNTCSFNLYLARVWHWNLHVYQEQVWHPGFMAAACLLVSGCISGVDGSSRNHLNHSALSLEIGNLNGCEPLSDPCRH